MKNFLFAGFIFPKISAYISADVCLQNFHKPDKAEDITIGYNRYFMLWGFCNDKKNVD